MPFTNNRVNTYLRTIITPSNYFKSMNFNLKHRPPTFKQQRVAVTEVDQSGKSLDGISLGQLRVLNLHHVDAEHITFIIYFFQPLKNLVTDVAV